MNINNCRSQLRDAILEVGIPFNRAYGMHVYEYPGIDPKFNEVLNAAMNNHEYLYDEDASSLRGL